MDYREKVNGWAHDRKSDIFTATIIFLVGLGSFGLGRLSAIMPQKSPLTVTVPERIGRSQVGDTSASRGVAASGAAATIGKYVGAVSGTAYHLPWCSGAQRIKEQNKVWFQTKEEAEAKGYKPAGNCPGL